MISTLKPVPWALHLAVLAIAIAFPFVFPSSFMVNFGVMALFYAFIGQSWNISGGFAGQLSFGHVAFFGVGAYASTIVQLRLGWSPWLGLPASRQTLTILRNISDRDVAKRFLEPLRSMLWEPRSIFALQRVPEITDRYLARACHALAA